jgi:hypothetical protein
VPVSASSVYGPEHELYSTACRSGVLVALGAKPGGAHGNPRISTYRLVAGVLTEVPSPFGDFGGEHAVNVARVTVGDPGFLITGNRTSGAAVWLSPDGGTFDLVEEAPGLATGDGPVTWDADAAWLDGAWQLVGATAARPLARDAAAWRSPDGRTWTPVPAEAGPDYDEIKVACPAGDTLVALGVNGDTFQTWRYSRGDSSGASAAAGWALAGRFGSTTGGGGAIPAVAGLATDGDTLLAAVVDTPTTLWRSADGGASWRPVTAPAGQGMAHRAAVAGWAGRYLLVLDDRVFLG